MTVVEVIAGGLNSLAVKHEMSGLPKSALKHNNLDYQYFVDFWTVSLRSYQQPMHY